MLNTQVKYIHTPHNDVNCFEYLLAVSPAIEVDQKVLLEKEWFYNSFQHQAGLVTKPHIAIAGFMAKEMLEETLIRWIQKICNVQKHFSVSLNNYSGIPAHTIYLRVQDPLPFRILTNQLKMVDSFIQSNNCPPVNLITAPHLVIADRLPEDIYNAAIYEFAARSFYESFEVSTLTFLKRKDRQKQYELVNTFTLPAHSFL